MYINGTPLYIERKFLVSDCWVEFSVDSYHSLLTVCLFCSWLTTIENIAKSILVTGLLLNLYVIFFLWFIPRTGISGPRESACMVLPTIAKLLFRKVISFYILSYEYMRVSPYIPTNFWYYLSNFCELMDIKGYIIIVLICISLIINKFRHLHKFSYHLGFLFCELPVYIFVHLSVGILIFFKLICLFLFYNEC